MTVPELPEDLTRWPDDAHELLGVERGVAPRDLKRNYTRLIKLWKPEHHPEHFRRIREAYESVLRHIEIYSRFETIDVSAEESSPSAAPEQPAAPAPSDPRIDPPATRILNQSEIEPAIDPPALRIVDTDPEPLLDPPAPTRSRDDLTQLWHRAIEGEEADAYRGLSRLYHEGRQQTAIALRLYWLLSLDPALDPEKQPCDWLIAGLRQGGLQGSCMELYRREIEANPEEAFSSRFAELLRLDAPTGVLAEIFSWRWIAIRRAKRWDLFDDDLKSARERIGRVDDAAWLRLVLVGCDGAAWIREGQSYSELWDLLEHEIQHLQHLANRHGEWFDRFEFLSGVRRDWQTTQKSSLVGSAFLDLIANAWNAPVQAYQSELVAFAGKLADDPRAWLKTLDRIQNEGPQVLHAIYELLRQAEWRLEEPAPRPGTAVIHQLAKVFMGGLKNYSSSFRLGVVQFCFGEAIDPAWMIEPLLNQEMGWYSPANPEQFVQIINDLPVRILCLAYRLFWMSA